MAQSEQAKANAEAAKQYQAEVAERRAKAAAEREARRKTEAAKTEDDDGTDPQIQTAWAKSFGKAAGEPDEHDGSTGA